ncbi:hypothetical protein AMS68_002381 [Peltaster fructicola]|uniref:AAA+ ATPase domain-containing protein n=1 Tax=Peltaster fructicola TaxID=286661 RepID=A0A6H0XQ52_9PEZI|nr:hypothetical protein AMS68_002381 [Peltaster fructicola]
MTGRGRRNESDSEDDVDQYASGVQALNRDQHNASWSSATGVEVTNDQNELVMLAELKNLDHRSGARGQTFYTETAEDEEVPQQKKWWDKFALCLVRHLSRKTVERTELRINSPHLKTILRDVAGDYPNISFTTRKVTVREPYHVLFHHHLDLAARLKTLAEDSDAAKHLTLLLGFIQDKFSETIEESAGLREQNLITHSTAWTMYKSGTILLGSDLAQPRAYKLRRYQYEGKDKVTLKLYVDYVDYDGNQLGLRHETFGITEFSGSQPIDKLPAFPLECHPNSAEIRARLLARGRRFEKLTGMHFQYYEGLAIELKDRSAEAKVNHEGRIVIDGKTFRRMHSDAPGVDDLDPDLDSLSTISLHITKEPRLTTLTDAQCVLANATVLGFSFATKAWYKFYIDGLQDIEWNKSCFDKLVLPEQQKDTVKALVSTHIQNKLDLDDIVKGKGQGLVLLLHGPPGVGKTLTAETVAEFCRRPLYTISSGDLGTNSSDLNDKLEKILSLASTWKAVLLIDEADVFLERRSLHDMDRNALVSIFLRVLEWYNGILFLTTNRVETFDDAFKSRIHAPLKYTDFSADSRKQVWKTFLSSMEDATFTEKEYDVLTETKLNGRQIKNVVRTAKSLSQYHGEKLDTAKLLQVIDLQNNFEQDLASWI